MVADAGVAFEAIIMDAAHIIILILLAGVSLVLLLGVALMARGGKLNEKYGNKLMVLRVALQGAIVLMLGMMFMFRH